jgi:hypothetical protein
LLKGRFFYPYRLPKENWTPKYAIPSHSDGWWLSAHDFLEHYATSASRWAVLAKPYWLSELMGSDCVTLFATTLPATEFIQQHVLPDTMCATAIVELSENSEGKITEVSRGFIIPNDWLSALTSQ